jgi:hypothetical protein
MVLALGLTSAFATDLVIVARSLHLRPWVPLFMTQCSRQAPAPSIDVDSDFTHPTINTRYVYPGIVVLHFYAGVCDYIAASHRLCVLANPTGPLRSRELANIHSASWKLHGILTVSSAYEYTGQVPWGL